MKVLVAMCLMAVGVSAQWGDAGVVHPDGTLQQFTREEAENVATVGESGVVFHDGTHIQFDRDSAAFYAGLSAPPAPMPVALMVDPTAPYGASGLVMPEGNNVQFTPEQAANIAVIGHSGVVMYDGSNVQLNEDGIPARKKRAVALEGPSGVQFDDGQLRHLPAGVTVVEVGESGAVLSNGDNVQFRKKRAASKPVVGDSGYITSSGRQVQFDHGVTILIAGDTGLLLSNGEGVQLYDRKKRSSGAVVGDSGIITPSGRLIQLAPGVTVVNAGPSAALLSTGEGIQYSRKKRAATSKATVGESGIITPGGRLIQLPHGVHVVLEGPSAALLSNGDYVQYEF